MENEVRARARPTSKTIIQVVFSCILVTLLILSLFDPGMWNGSRISDTLIAAWVMMGILAIVIFLDLWQSIMLLKSTKDGAKQVSHGATICRNFVILFLSFFIVF